MPCERMLALNMHAYETKKVEQRELKALGSQGLYSIVWFFLIGGEARPYWKANEVGSMDGWMKLFTSNCVCG